MNTKTAVFPTIFAIIMAIAGLGVPIPGGTGGTPWLTAVHQQTMPDGQIVNVDNIAFFLWGHQYTVIGKIVQSSFTTYDQRDFPFYSMIFIILAILMGVLSIMANMDINTIVRGKEVKIKFPKEVKTKLFDRNIKIGTPVLLLIVATILMAIGTVYLDYSARVTIIPLLQGNHYITETGFGFQFMEIGVIGFVAAMIMTGINARRKESGEEDIGDDYVGTDEVKSDNIEDIGNLA